MRNTRPDIGCTACHMEGMWLPDGVRRTSAFRMRHTTARGARIFNPLVMSTDDQPDQHNPQDSNSQFRFADEMNLLIHQAKRQRPKRSSRRLPNHEPIAHSTTGATHKQTTPMRDQGTCKHTLNRSNPEGQPSDSRGKGALRLDDAFMTDRGRPSITPAIRRDPPGGHHDNLHIPLLLADFTWPRNMGRATQCDNTRHQDAPQKTVQQRARDNID